VLGTATWNLLAAVIGRGKDVRRAGLEQGGHGRAEPRGREYCQDDLRREILAQPYRRSNCIRKP
jgi:hypothetical protein